MGPYAFLARALAFSGTLWGHKRDPGHLTVDRARELRDLILAARGDDVI